MFCAKLRTKNIAFKFIARPLHGKDILQNLEYCNSFSGSVWKKSFFFNLSCSFLLATSSCGIWQSIFCFLMLIWNIFVCELKIWFRNRQTFSQRHFADFVIFPFMTCITFAKVFFFYAGYVFFLWYFSWNAGQKKKSFLGPVCLTILFWVQTKFHRFRIKISDLYINNINTPTKCLAKKAFFHSSIFPNPMQLRLKVYFVVVYLFQMYNLTVHLKLLCDWQLYNMCIGSTHTSLPTHISEIRKHFTKRRRLIQYSCQFPRFETIYKLKR